MVSSLSPEAHLDFMSSKTGKEIETVAGMHHPDPKSESHDVTKLPPTQAPSISKHSNTSLSDDVLAHAASSDGSSVDGVRTTSTDDATVCATSVSSAMRSGSGSGRSSLSHGAARAIGSVEGSTAPGAALVGTPASLASPDSVVEAIESVGTSAVDEGGVAEEGNVVDYRTQVSML